MDTKKSNAIVFWILVLQRISLPKIRIGKINKSLKTGGQSKNNVLKVLVSEILRIPNDTYSGLLQFNFCIDIQIQSSLMIVWPKTMFSIACSSFSWDFTIVPIVLLFEPLLFFYHELSAKSKQYTCHYRPNTRWWQVSST